MAKRFIETNFFKDPFVRGLQGAYKGLYIYLFLDCSNAGIWNVELDVARLRCGIPDTCSDEDIKAAFSDKIIELEGGEKWLIKNFIKLQHNGLLKRNNKAHTAAINELLKYDLLNEKKEGEFTLKDQRPEGASEGLVSPTGIGIGNGSGKGKGKGKKGEKPKIPTKPPEPPEPELILPFESENFKAQWQHWKIYKKKEFKFDYKSLQSEQAALTELSNKAKGNEETAIAIIHQSMANGWKGFFELKNNAHGNSEPTINRQTAEVIRRNSEGW
ncbi:hypothetical protein [Salinimicrobium sp. GXAS 041]|uniref:hypothetical protein n=1 Tax=Salinimicrobium sp. GXAS 041 TaxID=3400806 RepID=UPI003C77712D